MRDLSIVAGIYCILFFVLTLPTGMSYGSLSVESIKLGTPFIGGSGFLGGGFIYMCDRNDGRVCPPRPF